MRPAFTKSLLAVLILASAPVACTLITEVDRSKIKDDASDDETPGTGGADNMGGDVNVGGEGGMGGDDTGSGGSGMTDGGAGGMGGSN
jgi:hypothetical protein